MNQAAGKHGPSKAGAECGTTPAGRAPQWVSTDGAVTLAAANSSGNRQPAEWPHLVAKDEPGKGVEEWVAPPHVINVQAWRAARETGGHRSRGRSRDWPFIRVSGWRQAGLTQHPCCSRGSHTDVPPCKHSTWQALCLTAAVGHEVAWHPGTQEQLLLCNHGRHLCENVGVQLGKGREVDLQSWGARGSGQQGELCGFPSLQAGPTAEPVCTIKRLHPGDSCRQPERPHICSSCHATHRLPR